MQNLPLSKIFSNAFTRMFLNGKDLAFLFIQYFIVITPLNYLANVPELILFSPLIMIVLLILSFNFCRLITLKLFNDQRGDENYFTTSFSKQNFVYIVQNLKLLGAFIPLLFIAVLIWISALKNDANLLIYFFAIVTTIVTLYVFLRFIFLPVIAALEGSVSLKKAWCSSKGQSLKVILNIFLPYAPLAIPYFFLFHCFSTPTNPNQHLLFEVFTAPLNYIASVSLWIFTCDTYKSIQENIQR